MTTSDKVAAWLAGQGLSAHTVGCLSNLTFAQLKSLMISDFGNLGVADMSQKQRLFAAIQQLKASSTPTSPHLTPQPSGGIRCGFVGRAGRPRVPPGPHRRQPPRRHRSRGSLVPPAMRLRPAAHAAGLRRTCWWTLMATTTTSSRRCTAGKWLAAQSAAQSPAACTIWLRPARRSCPSALPQDLDLEGFEEQAFSLSPAQAAPGAADAAGGIAGVGAGASMLLASLPDAPKIRVIVRKRPLNRKVRRWG